MSLTTFGPQCPFFPLFTFFFFGGAKCVVAWQPSLSNEYFNELSSRIPMWSKWEPDSNIPSQLHIWIPELPLSMIKTISRRLFCCPARQDKLNHVPWVLAKMTSTLTWLCSNLWPILQKYSWKYCLKSTLKNFFLSSFPTVVPSSPFPQAMNSAASGRANCSKQGPVGASLLAASFGEFTHATF